MLKVPALASRLRNCIAQYGCGGIQLWRVFSVGERMRQLHAKRFWASTALAVIATGASGAPTPIDTNAPYYLSSQLGISVLPIFAGGTLRIDESNATYGQDFQLYDGRTPPDYTLPIVTRLSRLDNFIDLNGNNVTFSGTFTQSGQGDFERFLTIKQSGNGGTLFITGNQYWDGMITIDPGATVSVGDGGTGGHLHSTELPYKYYMLFIVNSGTLIINHSDYIALESLYVFGRGAGAVEIAGSGIVSGLSCQTCTGGVVIDEGATLENADISGGKTTINGLFLVTSGTRVDDLAGSGNLHVMSGGLLEVEGQSTFTGTTLIDAGGQATAPIQNVIDNGMFTPTGPNGVYSGNISGDGDVRILSSTTMNGVSTYAGTLYVTTNISLHPQVETNLIVAGPNALSPNALLSMSGAPGHWEGTSGRNMEWVDAPVRATLTLQSDATIAGFSSKTDKSSTFSFVLDSALATIHLNGYTLDVRGGGTFKGNIDGSGRLLASGGTLTLSGTNSFTGGTVIASGATMNVLSPGAITGPIAANGTLALWDGTYGNAISGTGVLAIDHSVVLTGTSRFAGTTAIGSEGMLQIASGGVLEIGDGGTTGSLVGDVTDNGRLKFNRSDRIAYGGVISGSGAVDQVGTGTLILNGANLYTGDTTVRSGSLVVGDESHPAASLPANVLVAAGATLSGHGTIGGRIINAGTVRPGGSIGTLTVSSFTQSSSGTLEIEVSPSAASLLQVTGAANLDGTLKLDFDAGSYGAASYPIINAASVSGMFASTIATNSDAAGLFGPRYTPTGVKLVMEPVRDSQIFGDVLTNAFAMAETLNDLALDHFAAGFCDRSQGCPSGRLWLLPFAGTASYTGSGDILASNTHWAGVMGGVDVQTIGDFTLNLAAAYASSTLAMSGKPAAATTDTAYVAAGGGHALFGGHIDVNAHWLHNSSDVKRNVVADGVSAVAASKPAIDLYGGAVQYSRPLLADILSATARLVYTDADRSSFGEAGAQPFDFSVTTRAPSTLYTDWRLHLGKAYQLDGGASIVPDVSGGVRAILSGRTIGGDVALADASSKSAAIPVLGRDTWTFVGGVGIRVENLDGFSLSLHAGTRIGDRERMGEVTAEVAFDF